MKRKQGAPRTPFTKAKISLWILKHNKHIQPNQAGYCDMLYYYGRVCWDAANQLKKSLPSSAYEDLVKILAEDDARDEN